MPNTPNYSFPYPTSTDSPDGPTQFMNLANAIDSRILTVNNSISSTNSTVSGIQSGITANHLTCAYMRNTASQLFTNANQTYMLQFNTHDIDTDNGHSTVTNTSRWTCPSGRAGKYLVTGGYSCNPAATPLTATVYKNNGIVSGSGSRIITPSGGNLVNIEANLTLVTLNVGDYLEIGGACGVASNNVDASTGTMAHMLVVRLPD